MSDEYLIKDNHVASTNIKDLIIRANKSKTKKIITVEIDNLKQHYKTEASGNITLKNVRKIAGTGVDRISVGKITHSIIAVDLKLEI